MADTKKKGGVLNTLGITPQFVSNTVSYGVSSGIQSATNQLFAGVGNQYLAQAASSTLTNVASNVVNVAISSALGQKTTSLSGLSLSSGANILASTVTPYVTGALAQGINQSLQNSLKSAGPFGEVLAQIGTSFVNQGLNGLTNLITGNTLGGGFGGAGNGVGLGTKYFPGGGGEPDADYSGGGAYTLGANGPDVVFSIRPANSGPQLDFLGNSFFSPKVQTSVPLNDYLSPNYKSSAADAFKPGLMSADFGIKPTNFDPTNNPLLNPASPKTLVSEALSSSFISKMVSGIYGGWKFICAPEEISWSTSNAVNRVDMFGTNNPPAVSGTRGMREFTMRNSLVEGFTRNKTVEEKISSLEQLLAYKSSTAGGYVNVPVYQIWANNKAYGQQGYFLIKSVQVKEMMRDLSGSATRASVDVTFLEVPSFQVDSGLDQAPFSQQGKSTGIVATGQRAFDTLRQQANSFPARANQVNPPPVSGPRSASSRPPR